MAEFAFTEILPLGPDTTPYRLVSTEGVETSASRAKSVMLPSPAIG